MINKGRIQREIRDFLEIFWNWIKSDNESDVGYLWDVSKSYNKGRIYEVISLKELSRKSDEI